MMVTKQVSLTANTDPASGRGEEKEEKPRSHSEVIRKELLQVVLGPTTVFL